MMLAALSTSVLPLWTTMESMGATLWSVGFLWMDHLLAIEYLLKPRTYTYCSLSVLLPVSRWLEHLCCVCLKSLLSMITGPPSTLIKWPSYLLGISFITNATQFLEWFHLPGLLFLSLRESEWEESPDEARGRGWKRLSSNTKGLNGSFCRTVSQVTFCCHSFFFSSRAIVERGTVFQQHLRWIQRGQMRIKYWSTLAKSLLEDWTPVWKPLIYFSESEGSMCWVHSRPTGSISLPGTDSK